MTLDNAAILVTGGTGSFGQRFIGTVLEQFKPKRLIVFSRDEFKQFEMAQTFSKDRFPCMRYFLGDVRDPSRLHEALHGVDVVIHTAALKQVPACEYNPFEAVMTNVMGTQNVIRAAIGQGVKKVVALSTDKAANPINLYGATKLCSDKLFLCGNDMSGDAGTRFAVVRYGNVAFSRGSVIPFFIKKRQEGVLPVTDPQMTRFSLTLQQGVDFVLRVLELAQGGEIFVPKIPSYRILDLAMAVAPSAKLETMGPRPGEKTHESLIPADEAHRTMEYGDHFVIQPDFDWRQDKYAPPPGGKPCAAGFSYRSDTNPQFLSVSELRSQIEAYCQEHDLA